MKNKFLGSTAKGLLDYGGGSSQVLTTSGRRAIDVRVTSGGGSIEHPLSIHSASIGTRWKPRGIQVLLTLVLLFTMGIGQMWGDCETGTLIFSMEVTSNPASKIQIAGKSGSVNGSLDLVANTNVTVVGTSAVMYNSNSSAYDAITTAGEICFKNSSKHWIEISFPCALAAGDLITFTTTKTNPIAFSGTASGTKYSTTDNKLEISTSETSELIDKTSLWIWRPGSEPNVKSLRIIRPATITLDAATNGGTVSVTSIKGATGDKVVLPHAFKNDAEPLKYYKFKGWYTAATEGTKRADYYTMSGDETVVAQFEDLPAGGEMFSLEMQESMKPAADISLDKGQQRDLLEFAIISGGAAIGANTTSSSNHFKITSAGKISFNGTAAYLIINLDFPLAAGDVIATDVSAKTWVSHLSSAPSSGPYVDGTNTSYTIKSTDTDLIGATTLYLWRGSNATLSEITITRPTPHTLSYAVDPTGKGTVTLGATSVAEGATTTATYSDIDAAYEFDEWQISGTGASLDDASANPVTVTMGTSDATITLKLKLATTKYAITYDKGANGTGTIAAGEKTEGVDFTLSSDMFTRENYLQVGWTKTDGTDREYMIGGTYSTDAAETFYPAWAEKDTYVAAFVYDSESPVAPADWEFSTGDHTASSNSADYVATFGSAYPSDGPSDDNFIAFGKGGSAYAIYDLGYITTVSNLTATLYGGSSSDVSIDIQYLTAKNDATPQYTYTAKAKNWGSSHTDAVCTEVVPNVRYIKVKGAGKWVVMSAFSVTYGDLSTKYSVTYNLNGGSGTTPTQSALAAGKTFTLHNGTTNITAPTDKVFSNWKDQDDASFIGGATYTMPAKNVTLTAQWIDASSAYDVTYTSAHGTAPDAENDVVSVVLAELSADGWAHKGWTADVDVTVDAVTVDAGDLIASGKTVILASDVTFTAVWTEVFTVTYNANGGTCETPSATWSEGDDALVLPTATKTNWDFVGWYDAATGGNKIASPYTPSASIELFAHYMPKLVQAIYSNTFDAFIKNQAVNVYYLEGESAPTLSSIQVLGQETPTYEEVDGNIKVTVETVDYIFPVTKTAVTPYTGTGEKETFDGTETYVKTGYVFSTESSKLGWKFSKTDNDWSRETPGNTRIYFFLGAAEEVAFENGGTARDIKVYRNGVELTSPTSSGNAVIAGTNTPAMYAIVSNQTSGDGALKSMTFTPWVPTTAVALKEDETPITEKEIWESASFTLTAEVTPDNASDKTITWTSSNTDVATVVNGVVTGVAANATPVTITASTVDGVTATCAVTVTAAPEPCETPTINTQPASQAYCAGSEPTLSVEATGNELHYAWFKEAGETDEAVGTDAASYTIASAGTYYVIVTNHVDGKLDASVTSANAVVTLNVAAAITTQPTNKRDVVANSEVTLSVVATNATGYQWYICDDAEKHNAAAISGAESEDYVFNCTANAYYYCVVGNACGDDLESNVVSVKLEPAGCNMIASIPDSEPYQYEQTGEWTLYGIDSNGRLSSSSKFVNNVKDFNDNTVNAIADQRVGIIFEKDVESLTLYATSSSTGRTWKSDQQMRVTSDDITSGSPVYTNVTATREVSTMPGNTKQYIFTANDMIIPAGKKAWLPFSGSINIFKICYSTALAEPKLPTLADQELCAGADYVTFDATITNAAACEGTVSYEWYETTDTENPVATTASYTPDADGTYYVVVKHAAAGHATRVAQSANLTVAHFAAPALESYSEDVFQHMGTEATLSVTATGSGLAYAWYTCDAEGNNAVAVDPAVNAASMHIASVAEGVQYYKVVISNTCDATTLSHIFKVEGWNQLEQVDVTETTVWDMANVSASAINLANAPYSCQDTLLLLANIDGVNNNASFNSQALYFEGQHIGRTGAGIKHLAGRYVQFNVTVPGAVFVTFESNGNNARTISINDKKCSRTTAGTDADDYITYALAVEPGSVEIKGYEGESANQYVRISKIEFKAEDNYHRTVNPAYLGTLCWTNNAILGGATLYEFAGKNENNYLVFDEVEENRLEAGKPYIFMPENGNTEIKLYKTDNEAALTQDQAPVNNMYGTITGKTLNYLTDADMYYFSSNHIWRVGDFTVDITLPAYYCYIDYPAVLAGEPAGPAAPGRRRVTMGVNGQNTATGIGEIEASETPMKVMIDGQLFIIRGEKMFDATGRLVK